jgi:excisionase family DNA binding protein
VVTQAPERKALTPSEAAFSLGVGENTLRELYVSGRLRSVRVNRRVLIPVSAIQELLSEGADVGRKANHG